MAVYLKDAKIKLNLIYKLATEGFTGLILYLNFMLDAN